MWVYPHDQESKYDPVAHVILDSHSNTNFSLVDGTTIPSINACRYHYWTDCEWKTSPSFHSYLLILICLNYPSIIFTIFFFITLLVFLFLLFPAFPFISSTAPRATQRRDNYNSSVRIRCEPELV